MNLHTHTKTKIPLILCDVYHCSTAVTHRKFSPQCFCRGILFLRPQQYKVWSVTPWAPDILETLGTKVSRGSWCCDDGAPWCSPAIQSPSRFSQLGGRANTSMNEWNAFIQIYKQRYMDSEHASWILYMHQTYAHGIFWTVTCIFLHVTKAKQTDLHFPPWRWMFGCLWRPQTSAPPHWSHEWQRQ